MNSRVVKFLLITLYLLSFTPTYAAELSPVYPPYPDVWGYDFSDYPTAKTNDLHTSVYKIENGDYWFEIWNSVTRNPAIDNVYMIDDITSMNPSALEFFGQKMHDNYRKYISAGALGEYFIPTDFKGDGADRIAKYILPHNMMGGIDYWRITFSNGESLEIDESNKNACWDTGVRNISFVKRDASGKELGRYAIILANPYASTKVYDRDFDLYNCGAGDDREVLTQLYPITGGMILLKDDTFLLHGSFYGRTDSIVVRFKQDLTTPYSPNVNYRMYNGKTMTKKIFVIPYQIIASLAAQAHRANQPVAQALQNRLIDFLADDYPLLQK